MRVSLHTAQALLTPTCGRGFTTVNPWLWTARLCCLHDTRLEPTHNGVDLLPVDGMPVRLVAGDRTSRCCHCCHLLCLLNRCANLSRDTRPAWEVSPLSRGVMLPETQPLSTPLQDGLRFFQRPLPAPPWARLTARFP